MGLLQPSCARWAQDWKWFSSFGPGPVHVEAPSVTCDGKMGENYVTLKRCQCQFQRLDNSGCFSYLGMDQYLLIPFLMGWTSIYQLFWGSLGTRVLTHPHFSLHVTCNALASLGTCREQCSALTVKTNPDLRSPGIFHIWEPLKWPRIMQHLWNIFETDWILQCHSISFIIPKHIPFEGAACASRIHEVIGCHWW